jgi:hypothetical protein
MPPMQSQPEKKSSIGPLFAVIVILALIIIGGLYFFQMRSSQKVFVPEIPVEQPDAITESLNQQSGSDELDAIEADLNATDLDSLDQGTAAIEAELQ